MTGGWIPLEIATASAAILMVGLGCLSASDARSSVEWQVLVTIAAALAVGVGIENSGAAQFLADQVFRVLEPGGPWVALAGVYLMTMLVTELITNNAAAALVFPFCLKIAELYGASERPFIMALIMAASASFITPIGYQTNMMVFGPGGYRFSDFFRVGTPLSLLLGITAVILIPWIWPFFPPK
jgi:di/tricarboxylate transporter